MYSTQNTPSPDVKTSIKRLVPIELPVFYKRRGCWPGSVNAKSPINQIDAGRLRDTVLIDTGGRGRLVEVYGRIAKRYSKPWHLNESITRY